MGKAKGLQFKSHQTKRSRKEGKQAEWKVTKKAGGKIKRGYFGVHFKMTGGENIVGGGKKVPEAGSLSTHNLKRLEG